MTTDTDVRALIRPYAVPWPPDDTEESISGANLHQTTVTNLRWGINEAAQLSQEAGKTLPWQASSQVLILGWRRLDGSAYRTFPDVFVYPRPIDPNRPSMSIGLDGPPVFIIEVLSDSTYDVDLDIETGKGYSYAHAGVREYLALDPTGMFAPEGGSGWRLVEGHYHPWERDAEGQWRSIEIGVAIGLEGAMATVYTAAGNPVPREGEMVHRLTEMEARMAREVAEMEARTAREVAEIEERAAHEAAEMNERIARQAAEIEELRRRLRHTMGEE